MKSLDGLDKNSVVSRWKSPTPRVGLIHATLRGWEKKQGHGIDLFQNGEVHNCFGEVGADCFVELKK